MASIETLIDFECDFLVSPLLEEILEVTTNIFCEKYPNFKNKFLWDTGLPRSESDVYPFLQFSQKDNEQLIQIRSRSFSFTRMNLKTDIDSLIDEIKWVWELYLQNVKPIRVRKMWLRDINLISIPYDKDNFRLEDYFNISALCLNLPNLNRAFQTLEGFLSQDTGSIKESGDSVKVLITPSSIIEDKMEIILDIEVGGDADINADNWCFISNRIFLLRFFKDQVFKAALTEKGMGCI